MTKRRYQAIPNNPGIMRILTLNEKTGKWEEPERGKKFQAYRYVEDADGKNKKIAKCFSVFSEATDFHKGRGCDDVKIETPQVNVEGVKRPQEKSGKTFEELAKIW